MQESDLQATSSTTRNTSEMLTLDLDSLSDKGVSLEESKENAENGDEFHQMPSCAPSEETPREHRKESEEQLQQEDKKVTEKRELTSYSTLRGTWALSWLQLKELLKKRLIVASRDFKGLFFQVVFPTMQILFVLSILTLSYSPAGRTLKLESKTLDKALGSTSPGILVPVQVNRAHIHSQQPLDNSPYMDVITPDVNLQGWEGDAVHTSGEASNYLLFTSKLGPDEYAETYRYASFIYNDSVTVNSTVNWGWVKENLDFLLENQAVLRTFLNATGQGSFVVEEGNDSIYTESVSVRVAVPQANTTTVNEAVTGFFDLAGNTSFISDEVRANVTDQVVEASASNGTRYATIKADQVTYNFTGGTATLIGATVSLGGVNTTVGNVTLPW